MPEYLAPGVFVEETSFRQKTIEGVSTSTTGFVGPCRFGPINSEPELLTSFADFERIYGGIDQLRFNDLNDRTHNYLAHAVRSYFEEGGRRLYVSRIYNPIDGSTGVASWEPESSPLTYRFRARHPGAAGNFKLTLIFKLGDNGLNEEPLDPSDLEGSSTYAVLKGISRYDVVLAGTEDTSPSDAHWYWVDEMFDTTLNRFTHRLRRTAPGESPEEVIVELDQVDIVRRLTVSVLVENTGRFAQPYSWEDLSLHPLHSNSISNLFAEQPLRRSTELYVPLVFETEMDDGAAIAAELMSNSNLANTGNIIDQFDLEVEQPSEASRTFSVTLTNGDDGDQPTPAGYLGADGANDGLKSGLRAFEDLENISILAAPGSSFDYSQVGGTDHSEAVARRVITHCERMKYRVAVLDSVNGDIVSDVRNYRSIFDSTRAAFYYPWIRTFDPFTEDYIHLPPSGSVTGIYARNDVERGVHKAPANEVVRMAGGLEFLLNKGQQEVLNPLGINCLRFFEGRGFRIWGARTVSSDPEWKYLNVRRYFAYLERSIERGTQWAVFENNGEALWGNVRRTIEDFLYNEWSQNHLAGSKPDQAYFVRCDRSTMTQNDLDNGRMICLIGVAPLRPAEFVIFRIGQKTADSR